MQNKFAQNERVTNAKFRIYPVGIYLLKVNNENSKKRCVIYSKLTNKDIGTTSMA